MFSEIEQEEIEFEKYRTLFLFTIRTFYNELFRKLVGIDQFHCLIKKLNDNGQRKFLKRNVEQMKLAINDLDFLKKLIWQDFNSGSQSFELRYREISHIEFILSSFYDYETTNEINNHKLATGMDLERLSTIFVSSFSLQRKIYVVNGVC